MALTTKDDISILGHTIRLGESKTIDFSIAKLYSSAIVEIPIIIERSINPGPTVLLVAGIHGDEINGVEVVRQLIAKKVNKPKKGTIICVPILNIFGFLNATRTFPDGRDLNRVFPGSKSGSLASRVAYHFTQNILPLADYCLDFHTGGAARYNAPQLRIMPDNSDLMELAKVFGPPFIVVSKNLKKSLRATCFNLGIPSILFEGGKSLSGDKHVVKKGVDGVSRVLSKLNMLDDKFSVENRFVDSIIIEQSKWLRANKSGLLHVKIDCGKHVEKDEFLATITDPYGTMRYIVRAPNEGYIINVNHSPIVYQGDAIFHISTNSTLTTKNS